MEITLYYAVNASDQGCIFTDRPRRHRTRLCWVGTMHGCLTQTVGLMEAMGMTLPPIAWGDDPIQLTLTITTK